LEADIAILQSPGGHLVEEACNIRDYRWETERVEEDGSLIFMEIDGIPMLS
jgi:hypothetical protein